MKIEKQKIILSILALGFFSFSPAALAINAVINWGGGALNISIDSDVNTDGTLVNAYNLGGSGVTDATVNGVTFSAFAFPADNTTNTASMPAYNFTTSSNTVVSYNNLGSGTGAFSGLSPGYQSLLGSAGGSSIENTLTLTISGLTIGQDYLFQFFTNNSASASGLATTVASGLSISLDDNVTNTVGDIGQFAVGTFTATDVTQTIDFSGAGLSDIPTINAFQLRVVPEPSSVVMMLVGVGGLAAIMRFRRHRLP